MDETKKLIEKLEYVYKLIHAMDNLNQEEIRERKKYIELPVLPAAPQQTGKTRKRSWYLLCLAAAYVLLTLLYTWAFSGNIMRQSEKDYQNALFEDKFDWDVNYAEKEGEYPGYRGDIQPYTRTQALLRALPIEIVEAAVDTAIGAVIVFVFLKVVKAGKKTEYKMAIEKYNQIAQNYHNVQANNQMIYERIEDIHRRKKTISSEYLANVRGLLPKEYCNMRAVGYFIRELKNGIATTLPEAIESYRTYQFREEMKAKMDELSYKQELARRQQEEMIAQQMIGNLINFATYMETSKMAADTDYLRRYVTGI